MIAAQSSIVMQWIGANEALLWGLFIIGIVMFIGTLIAMPAIVVRIPPDYFLKPERHDPIWSHLHPALRLVLLIGKNVIGAILLVAGIAMLVLPGQGLVTIVIGVMLLNFPGKYRLERWIASRKPVLRAINWLRHRAGREPLRVPAND